MFRSDKSESISKYVSSIIKMFEERGLNYQLTPMGTIFEVDIIEQSYRCYK